MLTKTLFSRGSDNQCEAYVKQKHTLIIRQDSSHYKPNILGSAFSACVESAKVGLGNVVTSTKHAWCALGMLSMVLTKRTCEKNSEKGGSSCTSVTLVGVGLMSGAMLAEPEAVAMGGLQSSLKTALANSQLVQEGRYCEFGAVVAHSSVMGGLKEAVKEVVYDSICNVAEAVGGELLAEVVSPGIDAVLMATSVLRKLKVEESPAVVESVPSCAGNKDVVVLSAKEVVECKRTKELAQRTCVSIMSKGTGIAVCIIAGPAGGIVAATMAKYFLPKFF